MKNTIILFLVIATIISCQTIKYPAYQQNDTATKGMVSAAQPLATLAGQQMLKKGGNAVDAAVAAAFALSVVEPSMSGIGGRLQAIIRLPNGEVHGIDATTEAPMRYDTATSPLVRYGYGVIGIPGVVAGLTKLQREHGNLPLETVMKPAIKYAEKGFPILKGEALRHAGAFDLMTQFEGTKQHFLNNGATYKEGEKWVQKELANTLSLISKGGHDAFYKGEIARKIVADFQAKGGILTMEDLANYKARDSRILSSSYRGHDLHGLWIPSFGAITIEIMKILEALPMDELDETDYALSIAQAIELAYKDRKAQLVANTDSIITVLTSNENGAKLAKEIKLINHSIGAIDQEVPDAWLAKEGHTTHLSVADESGLMVALTQSMGPNMGSKVVSPELGFLYAVTLGRYLGVYLPGQRAASHISPMLVSKDGQPFMALGAAGGSRIPSAIISVLSRMIDQDMSLGNALKAARVYHDGKELYIEAHEGSGWKSSYTTAIEAAGFPIKVLDTKARFGRVHAVHYDAERKIWIGGADPDWEGAVTGK